jgi:hypothetical protein
VHVRVGSQLVIEDEFGEGGCEKVAQEDAWMPEKRYVMG